MEKGYLAIILHAHLPFVRHTTPEDAMEENWLREAITEVYVPLLLVIDGLMRDKIDFRLTLSMTPPLASMLSDPLLRGRYVDRLERSLALAEKEMKRTADVPAFHKVARMYRERLLQVRDTFLNRFGQDLPGQFRRLVDSGKVEVMASAATHGYLPLLSVNPSAVRFQIETGIGFCKQLFGQTPKGFWLPECGYAEGIDEVLAKHDVRYTVLETHGVTRADKPPRYGVYAPVHCPSSGVAVFARDPETSAQVWSATEGYPGDPDYREFYRDIGYDLPPEVLHPLGRSDNLRVDTGFKYFRVTEKKNEKEVYVPEKAAQKAEIHAAHFVLNRKRQIHSLASVMDRKPIVVAPYDAELFGHWWYEGPQWLDHVIRKLHSDQGTVRLVTLSEYLEEFPSGETAVPCASSWGAKGYHETWLNERNDWVYRLLHQGAIAMERLAGAYPRARGLKLRALKQAARELLLAQASDWAFMMDTGAMADYGAMRTRCHMERLTRLEGDIHRGTIDEQWLSVLEEEDNIFPQIDYRTFTCQEEALCSSS